MTWAPRLSVSILPYFLKIIFLIIYLHNIIIIIIIIIILVNSTNIYTLRFGLMPTKSKTFQN